nr:ATP-binding protein [Actinoplanes sp. M2I2]
MELLKDEAEQTSAQSREFPVLRRQPGAGRGGPPRRGRTRRNSAAARPGRGSGADPRSGGSVTIGTTPAPNALIITVADTGVGIAPDDLPKAFDRFWRADSSRSRRGQGADLPLVRRLREVLPHDQDQHAQRHRHQLGAVRLGGQVRSALMQRQRPQIPAGNGRRFRRGRLPPQGFTTARRGRRTPWRAHPAGQIGQAIRVGQIPLPGTAARWLLDHDSVLTTGRQRHRRQRPLRLGQHSIDLLAVQLQLVDQGEQPGIHDLAGPDRVDRTEQPALTARAAHHRLHRAGIETLSTGSPLDETTCERRHQVPITELTEPPQRQERERDRRHLGPPATGQLGVQNPGHLVIVAPQLGTKQSPFSGSQGRRHTGHLDILCGWHVRRPELSSRPG